ncbi:hypothetical protein [Mycobacterium botniense]|uniref:Lipoprotein LppI n=1 Tax=Mycobacterium botniense TaxID=84962 RepID=A0A7I9Y184_9MYCO|nr:hypothetical protein [Mycobacterium botniense]GFG75809.1 hypothetical protein MBOT_31740 [Mycobacterium botniense]
MRVSMLVAVSLLVAGCSHAIGSHSHPTTTVSLSTTAPVAAPPAKPPVPRSAPGAGAPIADVIAWVEAAAPADAARYHSAIRDGTTTELGDDIAFTGPSGPAGKVRCMTDTKHSGATLSCLVDLSTPLPRPATAYGEWKGGWVDFSGSSLQVGSARADPGPFIDGDGPQLPDGSSLSFGDFRCRADHVGLFCVNYAYRSAVRLAAAGVEPFGCLRPVPPPDGVGAKFSC